MLNQRCINQKFKGPVKPKHDINAAKNAGEKNGSMFAAGWHQGQEEGITLASYAAIPKKVEE